MTQKSDLYLEKLLASPLLANVNDMAFSLQGRADANERLAEYLQDMCPAVLCINVSTEECVKHEHHCGIDFQYIANKVMLHANALD